MPNQINLLSPNFRKLLLDRNIVADTIIDNGLVGYLDSVSRPAEIESPPNSISSSNDIEEYGVYYRDLNVVVNLYQGSDFDYREASIENINTNSNIGTISEPYNSDSAKLNEYTENDVPIPNGSNNGDIRTFDTSKNMYFDESKQELVNITYKPVTYQTGSYLDENNNLNVGGPSTQPLDVVGSLLNGGVGFNPGGGISTNSDVRSSLAGRALVGTGLINDTKMGQLSVGFLATAIGNNVAFNLQQETLGRVNLNPLSLAKGNSLIVPNYSITVVKGALRVPANILAKMSGFQSPFSYLANDASIFSSESGDIGNVARANSMINNTGKGQVLTLFGNLNANIDPRFIGGRNGFIPNFVDNRTERGFNQGPIDAGTVYAYGSKLNQDGGVTQALPFQLLNWVSTDFPLIPLGSKSSYSYAIDKQIKGEFLWNDKLLNKGGYDEDFYTGNLFDSNTNSLLYKTQELFKTDRVRTLTSGHYVSGVYRDEINNVRGEGRPGENLMSKGSGVLSEPTLNGESSSKVFCRTWTTYDRYEGIQDLQKGEGLRPSINHPGNVEDSVLEDTGLVKIGPYDDNDMTNFMFSIENLAWDGHTEDKLMKCEIGPGDLLSGKKGRIMWFPPYDVSFNETTSVSWEQSNFIGRGEPVFTYNNTVRTGTLSWKIIIDHPNYVNYLPEDWSNDKVASFFAGCLGNPEIANRILTNEEQEAIDLENNSSPVEIVKENNVETIKFKVYFPNDSYELDGKYESGKKEKTNPSEDINYAESKIGKDEGLGTTIGDKIVSTDTTVFPDNNNLGLNGINNKIFIDNNPYNGWYDDELLSAIATLLDDNEGIIIKVKGYASTQGNSEKNLELSDKRANYIKDILKGSLKNVSNITTEGAGETGSGCITIKDKATNETIQNQDIRPCKDTRFVEVTIEYSAIKDEEENPTTTTSDPAEPPKKQVTIPISKFFTECHYFEKVEADDKFVFDNFKDKIKNFHPAFHSITPEGFNSRLNFLHQCTRQGPTENNDGNPNNLAFGKAPVCILRLGDFYHTKIIIDTLTMDFDPLVWDLNPEGSGVQPMIANVSINFSFIGGSSLKGPINKLQNAVSFNFFANTELYDPRAERIEVNDNGEGNVVPGVFPDEAYKKAYKATIDGLVNGNTNDTILSQIDVSKDTNSTPTVANEPNGDIKISGIRSVIIENIGKGNDEASIKIKLKSEGIYKTYATTQQIATDNEMTTFMNKGVKINIEQQARSIEIIGQEGVSLDVTPSIYPNNEEVSNIWKDNTNKNGEDLFKDYYYFGDIFTTDSLLNLPITASEIPKGNYLLSVTYDGQKVSSMNINYDGVRFVMNQ